MKELKRDIPPKKISAVIERKLNEVMAHWNSIMNAPTRAIFDQAWETLNLTYVEIFLSLIVYLQITWLRDHKEKFVKA
jgi:hypothetical protein